jgi:hypothetical protein
MQAITFLATMIKKDYLERGQLIDERTLVNYTQNLWDSLSATDRVLLSKASRKGWICRPDIVEECGISPVYNTYEMKGTPRLLSAEVPVIADCSDKRLHLAKRIVAAQLAKQFIPIPVDDPFVKEHIEPCQTREINAEIENHIEQLTEFAELPNEESILLASQMYREMPSAHYTPKTPRKSTIIPSKVSLTPEPTSNSASPRTKTRYHHIFQSRNNKWQVKIPNPQKGGFPVIHMLYATDTEAALAYDAVVRHKYGTDAITNFDEYGNHIDVPIPENRTRRYVWSKLTRSQKKLKREEAKQIRQCATVDSGESQSDGGENNENEDSAAAAGDTDTDTDR